MDEFESFDAGDIDNQISDNKFHKEYIDKARKFQVYVGLRKKAADLKPVEYKKPCFPVDRERLKKATWWASVDQKLNDPSIKNEEVDADIKSSLQHIIDYFNKFYVGTLTKKDIGERREGKFRTKAPYLPDPSELEVFYFLNLYLNIE